MRYENVRRELTEGVFKNINPTEILKKYNLKCLLFDIETGNVSVLDDDYEIVCRVLNGSFYTRCALKEI